MLLPEEETSGQRPNPRDMSILRARACSTSHQSRRFDRRAEMMASPSSASLQSERVGQESHYTRLETKRRKHTNPDDPEPSPREIGSMREPRDDCSASFVGSSSGIFFIRHVYNAFARRSEQLLRTQARDRSSVPGEDDRLRGNREDMIFEVELNSTAKSFSFDDLVRWTRSYFERWHPMFPFLDARRVLKIMETISEKGPACMSRQEIMIIRSIVSISLGDSRQRKRSDSSVEPVPATLVFRTVKDVMQDVQLVLEEPTTIPLLQAALAAQLTFTSFLRLNAASRVGGVITRTACHLGLHRCPGRYSCFGVEEINIRRRIFWSIYSLERYLSHALGIPLSIQDNDVDVCYPGLERHSTGISKNPDDKRLRLLCYFAKFSRIRGLIVEVRNKCFQHSHPSPRDAANVAGELGQWWNEVYDDVCPIDEHTDDDSEQGPILQPYHRLVLTVLRHEAVISLNRPLLAAGRPSPDYGNALQTCIASSRSLLAAMKRHVSSSPEPQLSWPSFTWATWMACLILLYAAWEEEFSVPAALRYTKVGISILENLALRGSSWPETCIDVIKSMESALSMQTSNGHQSESTASSGAGRHIGLRSSSETSRGGSVSRKSDLLPTHATNLESSNTGLSPVRPGNTEGNGYSERTASTGPQPFEPDVSSAHGLNREGAFLPPQNEIENIPEASGGDEYYLNGHPLAGSIFSDIGISNVAFDPNVAGHASMPFSPSIFMNDPWSVADAPWMTQGNFM